MFIQYTPQLNAFLTKLTNGEAETNELIQEIFIRIWLSRHLLDGIEQPSSWINGIAANVSFAWIKNRIRRRMLIDRVSGKQTQEPSIQAASPDKQIYLHDLQKLVARAVNHLSPQRRKIYQLSREQNMTIPEIADHLQISASTVKNTLVTALREIREYLNSAGYELLLFMVACMITF